jgi:ABC-2 type transport system ATP-binding protein
MITIKDLSKTYGETKAVDRISLDIIEGEIFGLLGPNGAGKTTLILMLSTLLEPSNGSATINGADVINTPQLVKRSIGILFQETSLDERLTGRENLEIQAVLHDLPKDQRESRITEMLDFVGLSDWADVPVEKYSGGMKRRLEIARCLIHRPKVLLLDEATLGLDPSARKVVWRYIQKLDGMTVVLATNYIEEAETLCDRIGIIDSGRIVAVGSPSELKSSLKIDLGEVSAKKPDRIISLLDDLPFINNLKLEDSKIIFSLTEGKRKLLLDSLEGLDLESFEVHKPTLSDVFFHYTGKSIEVGINRPMKGKGLGKRRKGR